LTVGYLDIYIQSIDRGLKKALDQNANECLWLRKLIKQIAAAIYQQQVTDQMAADMIRISSIAGQACLKYKGDRCNLNY
jgi:hypothetical protein